MKLIALIAGVLALGTSLSIRKNMNSIMILIVSCVIDLIKHLNSLIFVALI